jgi:hypothetical protein
MSTTKIFAAFNALPDDATEAEAGRAIMKALRVRLLLGAVVYVLWAWVRRVYVDLSPDVLDRAVSQAGSLVILVIILLPLLRIMRMDDAELDRALEPVDGASK